MVKKQREAGSLPYNVQWPSHAPAGPFRAPERGDEGHRPLRWPSHAPAGPFRQPFAHAFSGRHTQNASPNSFINHNHRQIAS